MNKKDYKAITEIIKSHKYCDIKDELCERLADYFEKDGEYKVSNGVDSYMDNDFKRKQFLKDCGVE